MSRRQSLIEKLQAVEYDMSMLGRHNRAWMTSGACMIARTSALRGILASHSFWFPGEDLETGVIAKHFRLSVRHLDMRFYTDAPPTFRTWFRQRRMWWAGSFRMAFVNADQTIRFPLTFVYTVCVVWLLWVAKWNELGDPRHLAAILPFILVVYTGVCFLSNWPVQAAGFYALFQVLVLPPLGALFYAKNRTLRPPGRYRIGFRRETLELDPARACATPSLGFERVFRAAPATRWYRRSGSVQAHDPLTLTSPDPSDTYCGATPCRPPPVWFVVGSTKPTKPRLFRALSYRKKLPWAA